jgi:hypothetical protein
MNEEWNWKRLRPEEHIRGRWSLTDAIKCSRRLPRETTQLTSDENT